MPRIDRCYVEITNVCNLRCDFCPGHHRPSRQLTLEEFDLVTERLRDRVTFLYFHLMGEPLLHPLLPQFITMARDRGFHTVLTSNGTLLPRAMALLEALPHKVQLSLHSHEGNGHGLLSRYMDSVLSFALPAAERGTCVVLRLWNQGGHDAENDEVLALLQERVPHPWVTRPDGFRLRDNLYLEFDRKFQWPDSHSVSSPALPVFCKALRKQIGILSDGSLVPCCLDHDGDITLGNIFTQTLDEILSSPRATALLHGFDHHTATEPLCQSCESALISNSFRGKTRSHQQNG